MPRPHRIDVVPRTLALLALALAVAAAACDGAATTTDPVNLGTPLALPGAGATTTLPPPPPTTAATVPPTTAPLGNPLTRRVISDAELLLMTMEADELPFPFFVLDRRELVANADAALVALREAGDEADDIARYGRQNGARADFSLPRLPVARLGVIGVHVNVQLFTTISGASGYLADFFDDASKRIGGGRPTDLEILAMEPFVVEDIGEEAVAFTLRLAPFGDEEQASFETLVALRLGRIVAFGSVIHEEDADFRLRAISLAERLEQHLLDVLRGTVRPPEPEPEPEPLTAYAFDFEQRIDRGLQLTTVETQGAVVVDDNAMACTFELAVDFLAEEKRYVIIGDEAWFDIVGDDSPGFTKSSLDTAFLESDVIFCPGWAVDLADSRLDVALRDKQGERVEVGEEGRVGLRYELGKADLAVMGFLPESTGIAVNEFVVVTDATEPWLLELDLEVTGPSRSFVVAFGDEFEGVDVGRITLAYEFRVTRVNDPELTVERPE